MTDNVNCGTAPLSMGAQHSAAFWMWPTSLAVSKFILFRTNGAGNDPIRIRVSSNGSMRVVVDGTVDWQYDTAASLITTAQPYCVAYQFDSSAGAGLRIHIYIGTLHTPLQEFTYAAQTDGNTQTSDSGTSLTWGGNTTDSSFVGSLFYGAVWNRVIPLKNLRDWQWRPRSMGSINFLRFGLNGTGRVIDESGYGNHGAQTGTVVTNQSLPAGIMTIRSAA